MPPTRKKIAAAVCALVVGAVATIPADRRAVSRAASSWKQWREAERERHRMEDWPPMTLWAWERPEDFTAIRAGNFGVAFLAKTIYLLPVTDALSTGAGDGLRIRPRPQPLDVRPGTPLMAVVRIETPSGLLVSSDSRQMRGSTAYSPRAVQRIVDEIAEASRLPGVSAVQIDFDAPTSERAFYRELLVESRKRLPSETRLSITALASWCIGDRWLEELPAATIDEAVPMLFRMGSGSADAVNYLHSGEEFPVAACRNSVGVSTDEGLSSDILAGNFGGRNRWTNKRKYVFSPRPWTRKTSTEIARLVAGVSKE